MARKTRYTVFDMLDDKGVFESNPANAVSPLYTGPLEYPKMLYHPKGEKRVVDPESKVSTAIGVQTIPARYELIHRVVNDKEEEKKALVEGWHPHPRDAMAAAGEEVLPPMPPEPDPAELEEEIRRLTAKLAASKAKAKAAA